MKPEDRYPTARAFREALIPLRDASFRRTALGNAVAEQAKEYRSALRELVDRHLEEARGTAGLPGISLSEAPSPRPADEPNSKREPREAMDAPVPSSRAAAMTIEPATESSVPESPPSLADSGTFAPSSVRAQGSDRFMTETGAATTVEVNPHRRRARSWVAGVAALVGLVGLGAFVVPRLVARSQASGAPSEGTRPAADESARIELKLTVTPKDALVHLDDMQIDRLPFAASFPKDKAGHKLTVEAPGFVTKSQVVVFDRDLDLSITLVPAGEVAKPAQGPDSEDGGTTASAVAQTAGSGKAVRRPYRPAASSSAARTAPSPPPATPSTGFTPAGDPWQRNGTKKKP